MASDEPSGQRPTGQVVLRIKLRYDDVETMVQRFAPNIGKSGLFLPTKSLQPLGAEVKFELRLATEQAVLVGLGRVKIAKPPDPADPKATFGMSVELMRVTRESRDLILKMLERRKELGLPEVGIPKPSDIDFARGRSVETVTEASVPVAKPTETVTEASVPIAKPFDDPATAQGPIAKPADERTSGPIPVAIPQVDSKPESLLTAPRRSSGPFAVAKVATVAPLAPEPPRRKRPGLGELIERASGPVAIAADPDLDADIDVAAVLARARVLAGGDLESELDALREGSSAPREISIEAASAELARQLGGAAVRRGWAPPPAVTESKPTPIIAPNAMVTLPDVAALADLIREEPVVQDERREVRDERADVRDERADVRDELADVRDELAGVRDERPAQRPVQFVAVGPAAVEPVVEPEPRVAVAEPDHVAVAAPEPADTYADADAALAALDAEAGFVDDADIDELRTPPTPVESISYPGFDAAADEEAHEVEPDQIHDEIHQLAEGDFEEVEHTQIGGVDPEPEVDPAAFGEHSFSTRPSSIEEERALEASLEAQLAEAEADDDDWGFGGSEVKPERPQLAPEYQQDYIVRFDSQAESPQATVDDAFAETYAAEPVPEVTFGGEAERVPMQLAAEPPLELGAEPLELAPEHLSAEEIQDFEILAEADADDADLLAAHGEADAGDVVGDAPVAERPSQSDFASRLDLGDDSDFYPSAVPAGEYDLAASAGQALAAFDELDEQRDLDEAAPTPVPNSIRPIYDDQGSSSYTLAGAPDPDPVLEFEERHAAPGFPPLNKFDQSDIHELAQPTPIPGIPISGTRAPAQTATAGAPSRKPRGRSEEDLESALEALDVDLDDLSIPHASPHASTDLAHDGQPRGRASIRPPSPAATPPSVAATSRPAPAPWPPKSEKRSPATRPAETRPVSEPRTPVPPPADRRSPARGLPRAPRATTDDGVLIEFDDFEEDDKKR